MKSCFPLNAMIFCILVMISSCSFAQTGNTSALSQELLFMNDTIAQLKTFTVKTREGKNYLHWKVANQKVDGTYLIYRSLDGINFSLAGKKTGVGVPVSMDIAYYFTDETVGYRTAYYRILHISNENTILTSESICVDPENKSFFSATK